MTAICGYASRGIDIDCGVWNSGQSTEHLHCNMCPFITQSILCVRPDALSPVLSQRVLTLEIKGFRGQRPGFTDPHTGVSESGEQYVMAKIRHIEEQGFHFGGEEERQGAPVKVAILLSETAVAKSTPWAIGNSEMRSGEMG